MIFQTDKTREHKSQSVAHEASQKHNANESNSLFVDNRPEAVVQRKLQKLANRYVQKHSFQIADNRHQAVTQRNMLNTAESRVIQMGKMEPEEVEQLKSQTQRLTQALESQSANRPLTDIQEKMLETYKKRTQYLQQAVDQNLPVFKSSKSRQNRGEMKPGTLCKNTEDEKYYYKDKESPPVLAHGIYQFVLPLSFTTKKEIKAHPDMGHEAIGGHDNVGSITRPKPVLYAGTGHFNQGILEKWDNNSGHFTPTADVGENPLFTSEDTELPVDKFEEHKPVQTRT